MFQSLHDSKFHFNIIIHIHLDDRTLEPGVSTPASCFLFRWSRVQILARRPSLMTAVSSVPADRPLFLPHPFSPLTNEHPTQRGLFQVLGSGEGALGGSCRSRCFASPKQVSPGGLRQRQRLFVSSANRLLQCIHHNSHATQGWPSANTL